MAVGDVGQRLKPTFKAGSLNCFPGREDVFQDVSLPQVGRRACPTAERRHPGVWLHGWQEERLQTDPGAIQRNGRMEPSKCSPSPGICKDDNDLIKPGRITMKPTTEQHLAVSLRGVVLRLLRRDALLCAPAQKPQHNIGALIIRIGSWGPLYYYHCSKEPTK